jgi:AraC-like DNA-binding protein
MPQAILKSLKSVDLEEFKVIRSFQSIASESEYHILANKAESNVVQLVLFTEGRHHFTIGGQVYTLFPDDLLILFPNNIVSKCLSEQVNSRFCLLELAIFDPIKKCLDFGQNATSMQTTDLKELQHIFDLLSPIFLLKFKEGYSAIINLASEIINKPLGYRSRVQGIIEELILKIGRTLYANLPCDQSFSAILSTITKVLKSNLSHPWTVSEMASFSGMGVTRFTEKVKSHTGFAPVHYLITLRITAAKQMLEQGSLSITAIALETGFYSSQHFSYTFKKVCGLSPSAFKRSFERY